MTDLFIIIIIILWLRLS